MTDPFPFASANPLVEWQQRGKTFIGTPQTLVDELTYANYAYNRQCSPTIPELAWERIYGPKTMDMEARYQQDQAKTNV